VYAAGWPPVFLGDLYYYMTDFDLTGKGHEIDTGKVGVHILSGEYGFSGTMEMGKEAHETIKGSTWTVMDGLGHFPISEDPEDFLNTSCRFWKELPKTGNRYKKKPPLILMRLVTI
jgi:pimeloyl-ACP methyl ester carboxylesterase